MGDEKWELRCYDRYAMKDDFFDFWCLMLGSRYLVFDSRLSRFYAMHTSTFLWYFFGLPLTLLGQFFDKKGFFPSILGGVSKKCRTKPDQEYVHPLLFNLLVAINGK